MFTGIALFAPCDQSFYPSLWGVALPDGQGDVLIDDGGEIDGRVVTDGGDVEGEQRGKGLGEVEGDNSEGVGGKPAGLQGKARSVSCRHDDGSFSWSACSLVSVSSRKPGNR